ncbi:MAG: MMPL family transporter, partial [Gaiellales bacterium]
VGVQALVGGQTAALADMRDAVNRDMLLIFPVAAGMILLILILLLRSVLAPLTLMIAVALGFAATLGFAVIVFQGIAGESGLNFTLPMFLYVFVVAIATDYNILLTARLREEFLEGRSAREGAALAIEHAGPTVASAGVILAGTFAALILTGIGQLVQLGSAIAFGVLLAAFLIAPIWVTSRATVLGRWMWWPGNHPAEAPTGSRTPPSSTSTARTER